MLIVPNGIPIQNARQTKILLSLARMCFTPGMPEKSNRWWLKPQDAHLTPHQTLVSAGESTEVAEYCWDGLERGDGNFVLLQWTLRGQGALEFEGEARPVHAGDLMVLRIPHCHRYWLPETSLSWSFVYFILTGSEAFRMADWVHRQAGPVVQAPGGHGYSHQSRQLLRQLKQEPERIREPFRNAREAYTLLSLLGEMVKPDSAGRLPPPFTEVKKHIQLNYVEPLSVDELARRAGISRFHFSREFRKYLGMSPRDYLEDIRMQRAAQYLTEGKLPINEIARAVGIPDPNYFSRVFGRVMGMSPRHFQRSGH